jgi:hypothetical protein
MEINRVATSLVSDNSDDKYLPQAGLKPPAWEVEFADARA